MFRRLSVSALLIATGVAAGLLLSGRVISGRATDADTVAAMPATPDEPAQTPASVARQAELPAVVGGPDFTGVAARTVQAVTNISSVQVVRRPTSPFANDPFFQYFFGGGDPGEVFGDRNRYESSLGSGVLVSPDGYVVTNNHVVGEVNAEVTVSIGDRRELRATIVGVDTWTDLALLKVEAANLPVVPWGDSSRLKVAEWVMAVGNPFSLNQTVTLGVVSALGRAGVGISTYEDFIQTDAAINPGNSGGALINNHGELVGINTAIFSQSGGYQGIGFAVPSNLVRHVVDDLKQYGEVRRGSIGFVEVSPLTTRLAEELKAPGTDGVVITQMSRQSAAYRAGLRPGDIVRSVNGQEVVNTSQFVRFVADSPIGSTARIEVLRDGAQTLVRVEVEQQQQRPVRRGR
ncbi:MAG TPA: trypsin-like peptidase domain-containing protein [Vicinamibacterales bacterium]|nr:trypsin-like peptidase domain-containing protein [Vicinamibacterales bacterium]